MVGNPLISLLTQTARLAHTMLAEMAIAFSSLLRAGLLARSFNMQPFPSRLFLEARTLSSRTHSVVSILSRTAKSVANNFLDVSWVSVEKNIAQFKVSTLACSPSKNGSYETAFQLVATVEATKDTEAAPYTFASGAPSWTLVAMPTSAEVIRACVSARFPAPLGPGRILLVESEGSDRAISCLFQGDGVAKQLFLTGAGRPISVSPNENYRG